MLLVTAVCASVEAPRLANAPLRTATEELVDAPGAIASATARVVANVGESHLGFDTNVYPGAKAMDAWRRSGDYEWVGYYLPAACHKDDSWSGKRQSLTNSGWGLAVIYVGQQTWGKSLGQPATTKTHASRSHQSRKTRSHRARRRSVGSMQRRSKKPVATAGTTCAASFVDSTHGVTDAKDAIRRAAAEGFPAGTVVFLDVEYMSTIPKAMRDYYKAWTRTVLVDGRYRPGIYAHTRNAESIYADIRDVFDDAGVKSDPPFWIAGTSGFDIDKAPKDVGHQFADVWQGMLDVVRTHNGVRLPIDISVASLPSPSSHAYAAQ